MEVFFISAIIAALVTALFLVSGLAPGKEYVTWTFGKIGHLAIGRRTFGTFIIIIMIALIVFIFLIVLAQLHPRTTVIYTWGKFFTGRLFVGTSLGFLFGVLLVLWLRALLAKKAEEVTWRDTATAVLLVLLFIVGGMSDRIASWANRLTEFSAGPVKLAFDPVRTPDSSRRGVPGLVREIVPPFEGAPPHQQSLYRR
jgi:hypothetical protein